MISYKALIINALIFVFCASLNVTLAQCNADFTVEQVEFSEQGGGTIELDVRNSESTRHYNVKTFKIASEVQLINEKEIQVSNDKLKIDGLSASNYWLRIEWGNGCYKTIGGLDGIVVGKSGNEP